MQFVLELNSEGLYQSSGKEKESCLAFPSSTKREIRHFHVVGRATTAKKCTKKRDARAKLFFANLTVNLLPFCRSRCCRRRRSLNSLLPLDNGQCFKQPMKKSTMVIKFDPYGALVINRGNRILIVIHLYGCSEYKLSTILVANVVYFISMYYI